MTQISEHIFFPVITLILGTLVFTAIMGITRLKAARSGAVDYRIFKLYRNRQNMPDTMFRVVFPILPWLNFPQLIGLEVPLHVSRKTPFLAVLGGSVYPYRVRIDRLPYPEWRMYHLSVQLAHLRTGQFAKHPLKLCLR